MKLDISNISIDTYSYVLPHEKIAQHPLQKRDHSKMLVCKDEQIQDAIFYELPEQLPSKTLLVFNETKVIPARLFFKKETGAVIELFCLEPENEEAQEAFLNKKKTTWRCLVGNSKKWKEGSLRLVIDVAGEQVVLSADRLSKEQEYSVISFSWDVEITFAELLESAGKIPLPPYIDRDAEADDLERYQTLFAKNKGSVAAPTAGLHFTSSVTDHLDQVGIERAYVTLHVGAGTFKPVSSDFIDQHEMHTEKIVVKRQTVQQLLQANGDAIAVGTTSLRTIESLYWFGVKLIENKDAVFQIDQWEPYIERSKDYSCQESMQAILDYMTEQDLQEISGDTQLMIVPGYHFSTVKGLLTNFHQPKSTLLLLVAALIGEQWKEVYAHALKNDYRFLSYGDCCLFS